MSDIPPGTDWMNEIRDKLVELFKDSDEFEGLARLLVFLDEEEKEYTQGGGIPPAWKTLRAASRMERMLKAYANQLIKDAQTGEGDATFRRVMNGIYEKLLDARDDNPDTENQQGWVVLRPDTQENLGSATLGSLAKALEVMPAAGREAILQVVQRYGTKAMVSTVDDFVGVVNRVGGTTVMVGLALLSLGYEACRSLRRWWKGEITPWRCAKNIIDSAASIAGGIGGGMAGVAIGSMAGPFGTIAGGLLGSVGGTLLAGTLTDRLTQFFFTLPKEEAVEKAYTHLGVTMKATNHEINQNFRALCLKHHPDKDGDVEEFLKVQSAMGIIKMARGEMI